MHWIEYHTGATASDAHLLPWARAGAVGVAVKLDGELSLLLAVAEPTDETPLLVLNEVDISGSGAWELLLRLAPAHYTDCAAYAHGRAWVPVDEIMKLCGLRADYRNRADWAEVAAFPKDVLDFGKEQDFPPAVLRLWNRIDPPERASWSELFRERNVRKNFIREIIQDYYDLAPDERRTTLAEAQQQSAQWKALSRPFPGDRFRDLVRRKRFPRFEQSRQAVEDARRTFPKINGVTLDVPLHLEEDTLSIQLRFRSTQELAAMLDSLADERAHRSLEEIFALL